jgi:hypothetical protein
MLRRVPRWLLPGAPMRIRARPSRSLVRFGSELRRACAAERRRVGIRALRELTHASGELFEGLDRRGLDRQADRLEARLRVGRSLPWTGGVVLRRFLAPLAGLNSSSARSRSELHAQPA